MQFILHQLAYDHSISVIVSLVWIFIVIPYYYHFYWHGMSGQEIIIFILGNYLRFHNQAVNQTDIL